MNLNLADTTGLRVLCSFLIHIDTFHANSNRKKLDLFINRDFKICSVVETFGCFSFIVIRQQFLLNLHLFSISQLEDRLNDQSQTHHPYVGQMTAREEAFTWSIFRDSELSI